MNVTISDWIDVGGDTYRMWTIEGARILQWSDDSCVVWLKGAPGDNYKFDFLLAAQAKVVELIGN